MVRTGHTGYFLPKVIIKDCNVMIHERKVFDQPVKNDLRTHEIIPKITAGQENENVTDCLLDYPY